MDITNTETRNTNILQSKLIRSSNNTLAAFIQPTRNALLRAPL